MQIENMRNETGFLFTARRKRFIKRFYEKRHRELIYNSETSQDSGLWVRELSCLQLSSDSGDSSTRGPGVLFQRNKRLEAVVT